ncbi:MAG: hypothetical protein GX279_00620 [Clostridiaceae bacterium]|nr:hypothetical protein [Clostridiaceae bacterium]
MERFKDKIRKRTVLMSLSIIAISGIYSVLSLYRGSMPAVPYFIKDLHTGAYLGIKLVLLFYVLKYIRSIRREEALKRLYIEENDERTIMIMQKSGASGMVICMIGFAIGTIVAGFFNAIMFFTLLSALIFIALVRVSIKIYYHFTM